MTDTTNREKWRNFHQHYDTADKIPLDLYSIVRQMNMYADHFIASQQLGPHCRILQWPRHIFDKDELKVAGTHHTRGPNHSSRITGSCPGPTAAKPFQR